MCMTHVHALNHYHECQNVRTVGAQVCTELGRKEEEETESKITMKTQAKMNCGGEAWKDHVYSHALCPKTKDVRFFWGPIHSWCTIRIHPHRQPRSSWAAWPGTKSMASSSCVPSRSHPRNVLRVALQPCFRTRSRREPGKWLRPFSIQSYRVHSKKYQKQRELGCPTC